MAEAPSTAVAPLEGKTTVDRTMTFGPERLSYASAERIAARIADAIRGAVQNRKVVVAGTPFLGDLANLETTRIALETLETAYQAVASHAGAHGGAKALVPSEGATAAPLALPALAQAATSVLGLVSSFREDVEYVGAKTVVNPLAFELALAARLRRGGAGEVYVPDLAVSRPLDRDDSLRARIRRVQDAKARAYEALGPLVERLTQLEADLDEASAAKDQKNVDRLQSSISRLRRDLDPIATPLSQADRQLADLEAQWSKPAGDEPGGVALLGRLLRAEAIAALSPLYLHAAVVSSGGHHRTSRSLLRMIFLGDGLTFAGGAIVRWALLDASGGVSEHGGIASEMRSTGALDAIASGVDFP